MSEGQICAVCIEGAEGKARGGVPFYRHSAELTPRHALLRGVLLRVRRLAVTPGGLLRVRRRFGRLRSSACGRRGGLLGVRRRFGRLRSSACGRRDVLLRVRRRFGRLRSSACGRRGVSGADGDHQLRCHGVVLVVAHAAVGEGSPNRDHALLPEAPEEEHHVAGQLRVRGEDLPL